MMTTAEKPMIGNTTPIARMRRRRVIERSRFPDSINDPAGGDVISICLLRLYCRNRSENDRCLSADGQFRNECAAGGGKGCPYLLDELLAAERLRKRLVRAELPGDMENVVLDDASASRHRENSCRCASLADLQNSPDALLLGHDDVGDDKVRAGRPKGCQTLLAIGRAGNRVPFPFEHAFDHRADALIVVDDQNQAHDGARLPNGKGRSDDRRLSSRSASARSNFTSSRAFIAEATIASMSCLTAGSSCESANSEPRVRIGRRALFSW